MLLVVVYNQYMEKIKYSFAVSIASAVTAISLLVPLSAHAATLSELQAKLAQLQSELAAMSSTTLTVSPVVFTALYMGSAPVSVSFSTYSSKYPALASGDSIGVLYGDGVLSPIYQRPECVSAVCDAPDLFAVHTYAMPATYTAKLVEYSGCATTDSMSGPCFGQFPKLHKILDTVQVVVQK